MDEITLRGGIHDTRKLAGALAELLLRKRGAVDEHGKPTPRFIKRHVALGDRGRRVWTAAELEYALELRERGFSYRNIGLALSRPTASVHMKITPRRAA